MLNSNILFLALLVSLAAARAQNPQPDITVDLGVEVAVRGEEVRLPIILTSPTRTILSAVSEVTFPSALFSFQKSEAGSGVEKDQVEISSRVGPAGSKEEAVVEVQIKSRSDAPLPNGSLAVLIFKVSDKTPAGDVVLKNSARVVNDQSQEVAATGKDGTVTILEQPPPVVACFFYMH